jgi:hypothetical protein
MNAASGSGQADRPAAIDECRHDDPVVALDAIVGRDRPLVIRGLVRHWPAVRLARQSDTDVARYLASLDSDAPVDALLMPPAADGIVGYNADMSGFNYERFRIPLTWALRRLAHYSREGDATGLAIQSAPVAACLPGFEREHAMPLLGPGIPPRIWIGNRVTTPAHFDSMHNIACVVCGSRRFTLFPPDQLPNLYIGPPDFSPTGAAISMARIDRPDDARFPRLRQALAAATVAELQPGDAIYIPPLWWHNVESLRELNALVNYWWPSIAVEGHVPGHELAALFHCILAFRALPPAQRDAWRGLLDHYVFGDGEPLAHVPPGRRGVLAAPLTAEQVETLKELARRHL